MFHPILQKSMIAVALALITFPLAAQSILVNAVAGQFEGDNFGTVNRFLGIPYAAAPVGDLRWKAPISLAGTGSLNLYDGANFAAQANAVYVTTNYRLGFLGGYRLPMLADGNPLDDSGNYSLLDIIRALRWVQTNVASFSGDGTNITLTCQSSGCVDIYSLVESTIATGTFQRAVCMSGVEDHSPRDGATKDAIGLVDSS